jgi:glycosyltransferase involved in cell wall biosynthesis
MTASTDPKVSVIMNCHNCSKYLREALDSIYQQTFRDYEIIFWDNKSIDNSADIALSYGKPLRYFRGEDFLPLGAARNLAIEKAKGDYIAFLDCDDVWLPENLEKLVRLLDSNKKLGLVYSDSYITDKKGLRKKTCFNILRPFKGNVFNELFLDNFIPLLTVMVRKNILYRVGIFNPIYEINEEYDLWLRIAENHPVDFIEQPLAKYRIHTGNVGKNVEAYVNESFQIMEYWLNKKPGLKNELKSKIKLKKLRLYSKLTRYYINKHENKKAIIALINSLRSPLHN